MTKSFFISNQMILNWKAIIINQFQTFTSNTVHKYNDQNGNETYWKESKLVNRWFIIVVYNISAS